jgi:hypothetical protein
VLPARVARTCWKLAKQVPKPSHFQADLEAGATGLEPATSGVTGRRRVSETP